MLKSKSILAEVLHCSSIQINTKSLTYIYIYIYWYISIKNWFIYLHNFYCPVFFKTIHIVLKIFWLFYSIYIYIYNPTYLYLYTSHRKERYSSLCPSYYNNNSKTYSYYAIMVPSFYCIGTHWFMLKNINRHLIVIILASTHTPHFFCGV